MVLVLVGKGKQDLLLLLAVLGENDLDLKFHYVIRVESLVAYHRMHIGISEALVGQGHFFRPHSVALVLDCPGQVDCIAWLGFLVTFSWTDDYSEFADIHSRIVKKYLNFFD